MSEKLIGFTDEEIGFAISITKYALKKLDEQHGETHSGVDRLLLSGWMVETEDLINKFEAVNPVKPEPSVADEELPERPEA
jgi:hypothetical protein